MDSDENNQEVINCENDGDYGACCNICEILCIERFYENHLKSKTHTNVIQKKQQSIKINCFQRS